MEDTGADSFLAVMDTPADPVTGLCTISPMIVELDGTPHPPVRARAVGGLTPVAGDTVLVITIRNDLDGLLPVSRYFGASEANCRVVDVVIPASGQRILTGNYKFTGALTVQGSLTVTGPVSVTGNTTLTGPLSVTGNTTLTGNASVSGNVSVGGGLTVTGVSTLGGIVFPVHTHSYIPGAGAPTQTGPPV